MMVNLCTRIIVFSRLSQSSANPNRVEYGSRVFYRAFSGFTFSIGCYAIVKLSSFQW